MDSELVTQVVALLTAALTLWQEIRHRKAKKAPTLADAVKSGPYETTSVPKPRKRK